MKILESKYYRPRKIVTETYLDSQYQIELINFDAKLRATDTPFTELLNSLMPTLYLGDNFVIKKEHLAKFVQCTDYHVVEFNKKTETFYHSELCYFYPDHEMFVILNEDLSNEYDKTIIEHGFFKIERIAYQSDNANALQNIKTFFDTYVQKYISPHAKISLLLKEGQELVFKSHTIKPLSLDLMTMYNDDFVPVHQKIKQELTHGNKGLVLLHGVAGSGKTNYIKWLTAQIPDKNFIFVPNNLIGALAEPQFMSMLIEEKNAILVLEDCENYIAERIGGGNTSDVVSTILNIADGILSDVLECQFICTFNADLTDIDHALLRHGRLIAEYQFGALTPEKANQYLTSVGKDTPVDAPKTLAELTHIDDTQFKSAEKKSGFGFV